MTSLRYNRKYLFCAIKKGISIKVVKAIVTCCGLGLLPVAPGTFGSAFGVIFVIALSFFSWPVYFWVSILFCALSLWAISVYLVETKSKDPKEVVADEVMGMLVSMLLVPISLPGLLIGFLLFRFLDILKPPPISFFDKKVPGAAGVMADDVVAGIIVNLFFHFVLLPYGVLDKINSFFHF